MMKSRHISIQTIEEKSASYAIAKARYDVDSIIRACGYKPVVFGSRSPIGFFRVLKRHYDIFSLKFRIRQDDVVFFQFPWIHNNKSQFYHNLFMSGAKVVCIIHDIDSLRSNDCCSREEELRVLRRCDAIIAHTPAMKRYLVENGIEADRIRLLHVFCYLIDDPIHDISPDDTPEVIFAGNITKSPFVNSLHGVSRSDLRFNIYGNGAESFKETEFVRYKGTFSPHHPGCIEGNWGLVWDGSRIDTCDGCYGAYLRYNSSHKIALYLSLGIPVVLWEESSLKDFIVENGLGITVASLEELHHKINSLTTEDKKRILNNVKSFAALLRNGANLKSLFDFD